MLFSNLSFSKIISTKIKFSGKGKLVVGKNTSCNQVIFSIEKESCIQIGDNICIGEKCMISSSKKSKFLIYSNVSIESGGRLISNGEFIINSNVLFGRDVEIESKEHECIGSFYIGHNSEIGDKSFIETSGGVIIGNNVSIGRNVTIYSHNHEYRDSKIRWKTKVITNQVNIEDGVWVASNAIILPGVKIGKNSVVAAGSVVTKNVAESTVVAGNPAKLIKQIND